MNDLINNARASERPIHRRAVLRGIGATLALPFMESLTPMLSAQTRVDGVASRLTAPPRRYATILFANGVDPDHWWAKGDGDAMELSDSLSPLNAFKNDMLVLNKLAYFDSTSGSHWPLFTNFLSGVKLKSTTIPDAAQSVDQLIARRTGSQTFIPSIHMGIETPQSGLSFGVPSIYGSTFSWSSQNTPIPPEISPAIVYDRLFDKKSLLKDKKALDYVMSQSKRVRRELDAYDRNKMDQFMESVWSIEQRIERVSKEERVEGWRPSLTKPTMDRPSSDLPQVVPEHVKLQMDLMVLAFQMDRTRVGTFLFCNDTSRMKYDFVENVGGSQLHGLSHRPPGTDGRVEFQRTNKWHVQQFAYLMEQLKGIDEGNGSCLDNSMLLFGSNMMDGNNHDGRELPLILAGGRNCDINPGRNLTYSGDEKELCNLHLSMAQRMGVYIDSFGDTTMPLPRLA